MRYCADTWFLLEIARGEPKAVAMTRDNRLGKISIIVPITAYAEATQVLLRRGTRKEVVQELFDHLVEVRNLSIVGIDRAIAFETAKVATTYGIAMMDAFAAATSHIHNCHALLAKDAHYGPLIKKRYLKLAN